MTIKEVLNKYNKIEIELLLAHVLRKSREFIFLHPEHILSSYHFNILSKLIRRREQGEPIAYILGYKDFYGLSFKVNRGVLIPRPETEIIIERLKDLRFKDFKDSIRVLDVGTGSGCIIISLANKLISQSANKQFRFYASDVSKKALNIAKFNSVKHRAKIRLIQSDLLENIKFDFDILVSNLPYLDKQWKTESIKYEPGLALFTEDKGLHLMERLLTQIALKKHKPKFIFLEFDPRQKKDLQKFIKKILPKAEQKFYKDFANRWRVVEIKVDASGGLAS